MDIEWENQCYCNYLGDFLKQKLVQIFNFQNMILSILISENKWHYRHGHVAVVQFTKSFPKTVT